MTNYNIVSIQIGGHPSPPASTSIENINITKGEWGFALKLKSSSPENRIKVDYEIKLQYIGYTFSVGLKHCVVMAETKWICVSHVIKAWLRPWTVGRNILIKNILGIYEMRLRLFILELCCHLKPLTNVFFYFWQKKRCF